MAPFAREGELLRPPPLWAVTVCVRGVTTSRDVSAMATVELPRIRKRLMAERAAQGLPSFPNEIELAAHAIIHYSSEDPAHPIERLFDGASGPGATRWLGAQPGTTQEILLEFDEAQHISRLIYDVEEQQHERTQEVRMEFSSDGGKSYRTGFVQEYTFSPRGSTYQCEDLRFDLRDVTHLRLIVVPNKGGSGIATLTSLRLFH